MPRAVDPKWSTEEAICYEPRQVSDADFEAAVAILGPTADRDTLRAQLDEIATQHYNELRLEEQRADRAGCNAALLIIANVAARGTDPTDRKAHLDLVAMTGALTAPAFDRLVAELRGRVGEDRRADLVATLFCDPASMATEIAASACTAIDRRGGRKTLRQSRATSGLLLKIFVAHGGRVTHTVSLDLVGSGTSATSPAGRFLRAVRPSVMPDVQETTISTILAEVVRDPKAMARLARPVQLIR